MADDLDGGRRPTAPLAPRDVWNIESRMDAWERTQTELDRGGVSLLAVGQSLRHQQRLRACAERDARSLRMTMIAVSTLLVIILAIVFGVVMRKQRSI